MDFFKFQKDAYKTPEWRDAMQKKCADVHRHLPTVAAILFPHFKEACWLRKFEKYRGCIVGLLCGFSLRDYSWW